MTTIFATLLSVNSTIASTLGSLDILTLIIACSLIFIIIPILFSARPGLQCPNCLSHGVVTWALPGKNCPRCGYPC